MKTELITIIDRSGSMQSIRKSAEDSYNQFLLLQKSLPGDMRETRILFNEIVGGGLTRPIGESPSLVLTPSGGTALYDAIGVALESQGRRIAQEEWAEAVIVCIVTDGEENSSRQYDAAQVKQMISHAQENGWKFVFLAANQDAFASGTRLGIAKEFTYNYMASSVGAQAAISTLSADVLKSRGYHDMGDKLKASVADKLMSR